MSTPARRLTTPVPRPARMPMPEPSPAPTPGRRQRHQLGFAVLASSLVGLLVLAIVVVHVLLAQQSFHIDESERRIEVLAAEQLELVRAQATLSAPGRIAGWATRYGMRLPDDIRILRAPDGPADPAGAGTSSQATAER